MHHPGIELGRLRLLLVDRDFTGEGGWTGVCRRRVTLPSNDFAMLRMSVLLLLCARCRWRSTTVGQSAVATVVVNAAASHRTFFSSFTKPERRTESVISAVSNMRMARVRDAQNV